MTVLNKLVNVSILTGGGANGEKWRIMAKNGE